MPKIAAEGPGADVPQRVRDDYIQERVDQKLEEIRRFALDRIRGPQRGLETEEMGRYVLPEDWPSKRTGFESLASEIADRFSIEAPSVETTGESWQTIEEVGTVEGLGRASTEEFGPRQSLSTVLQQLREFDPESALPLQAGMAGPPMSGEDGTLYFFRVLEADASRPPRDLDEVRAAVEEDLQRKARYEQIVSELDAIEAMAKENGLLRVALAYDAPIEPPTMLGYVNPSIRRFFVTNGQPLMASPTPLPGLGRDEDALWAIIDRGLELDAASPGRMTDLPRAERTFVVQVPQQMAVLVVEYVGEEPLSPEDYETLASDLRLQSLVLEQELPSVEVAEAFGFEAMKKRHDYREFRTDEEEAEVEDAGAGEGDGPAEA